MSVLPPGGYVYQQPETGMKFDGNTLFRAQARLILTHRKANALAGATIEQASEDLMAYTCARLPGICTDSKSGITQAVAGAGGRATGKCRTCGGKKKQ